jgi:hypothetical protein
MIRYQLALFGHSQRYLLPALAFTALLGLLYGNETGATPPTSEFAVSAGALFVVGCWLTIALVDSEDSTQRLVTLSHARRLVTLLGGMVLAVFACCAALTVLAVVWSVAAHQGDSAGDLGFGLLAHLACAIAGIAIGLPCSRLLVPRAGYAAIAALIGLGVVLTTRWIPFVNPMLHALSSNRPVAVPVLLGLLTSLLALAVSSAAVAYFVPRRS